MRSLRGELELGDTLGEVGQVIFLLVDRSINVAVSPVDCVQGRRPDSVQNISTPDAGEWAQRKAYLKDGFPVFTLLSFFLQA